MGIGGDEFDPDHWGCEYTNNGFVPGCPGSFWETCNYGTKAVSNDPTCQAFKDNPTVNPVHSVRGPRWLWKSYTASPCDGLSGTALEECLNRESRQSFRRLQETAWL